MLSLLSKSLFKRLPSTPLLKPSPFFSIPFCSYFITSKKDFTEKFLNDKKEPKKEKAFKRGDVAASTTSKPKKINDSSKTEKINKPKSDKKSENGKNKKGSQGLSEQLKKQMEKIENNHDFETISRPNKKNNLSQGKKEIIKEKANKPAKSERVGSKEKNEDHEKSKILGTQEEHQNIEKKEPMQRNKKKSFKKQEKSEEQEKLEIKEEPISEQHQKPGNKANKQAKREKPIKQENAEIVIETKDESQKQPLQEKKEKKLKGEKKQEKKVKIQIKDEKIDKDGEPPINSQENVEKPKKTKKTKKIKKEIPPEPEKTEFLELDSSQASTQPKKSENVKVQNENESLEHLSKESIFSRPTSEPIESGPKLRHFQSDMETIELPWDFHSLITKPKGTNNLMSAVDVMKFLKDSKVKAMIKDFLESLEENDTENLSKLLEFSFFKKLQKSLAKLKERNLRLEVENLHSKRTELGVYNILNYFTIGVDSNRTKNDAKSNYKIVRNSIGGVPTINIIHIKQENIQNIKIYVQLDIVVTSDFALRIKDQEGKTILGETQLIEKNKEELEAVKELVGEAVPKIIMKKFEEKKVEVKRNVHLLKIEGCIFEGDYNFFENQVKDGNLEKWRKENHLSMNKESFYIVDFDNYMNGNELVGETIRD